MNSTSGISGLTGGNTMQPPEPVLSRAEWERRYAAVPIRDDRRVYGSPPPAICPACTGPMREVPGYDDYCPACRMEVELLAERRAERNRSSYLTRWLKEWGDVSHGI